MSEYVKMPIIRGRNQHELYANLEGGLVSFRHYEEVFQWEGNRGFWDDICNCKTEDVEKFCKQLLQLIEQQRKSKK